MRLFGKVSAALGIVPSERVIAAMDPWTLACAVGAENGSGGMAIGFDMWFRLSRKNWLPELVAKTCAAPSIIESALRGFVSANRHRDMMEVMREQEAARGLPSAPVLGPGESMTISVALPRP